MRELSVYYCDKCGYYAYFQLPKNAVCHLCARPMIRLDMNHRHSTIWDELRKKQELKEEVRHLKKLLDIQQEDR